MVDIQAATMDRMRRAERAYKLAFVGAAVIEAGFLAAFLLLADFKRDRTHVLLLLSTIAVYTLVAFGLIALGAHVNRATLRVIKAIELLDDRSDRQEHP
jgi:hypothetical protein